jgi:hypothetical protein
MPRLPTRPCLTGFSPSREPTNISMRPAVIRDAEQGGLIPCPGGAERFRRKAAIRTLSWHQVEAIRQRFARLTPYVTAPGSVLKREDVNLDAEGRQREVWCYAISAKRYCFYTLDDAGEPQLVKWSEHGLGHLLNPTDPDSDDRDWMRQVWEGIVLEPGLHRLELVRLLADVGQIALLDRPALQDSHRLPPARLPIRPETLRLRVGAKLGQHVAIGLQPCPLGAVQFRRRADGDTRSRVAIDPR